MGRATSTKTSERFMELEGLRGIAALMVFFYHNLIAFYAFAFFGVGTVFATVPNFGFERTLHGNPLMAFASGNFAVALFFVLSGFVLSIGYLQTGNESIIKKLAAKRYLRLMLPALASVLLCYLALKLNLSHVQSAASLTNSGWLSSQWQIVPHALDAVMSAVWQIFFVVGGSGYNNVLWTMLIEFVGSFVVFGTLLIFGSSQRRWIVYCILLIATANTWYLGFILGMMLADLYSTGLLKRKIRSGWMVGLLLTLGIFLGGYPINDVSGTVYSLITIPSLANNVFFVSIYTLLGAFVIVSTVIMSPWLTDILKSKYISKLGKYTFSLYLVHVPILFTFTTFCFIHLRNHFGYNASVLLALTISTPPVIAITYLFEKYIDRPSIRVSAYFAAICLEGKELPTFINAIPGQVQRKTQLYLSKFSWRPRNLWSQQVFDNDVEAE